MGSPSLKPTVDITDTVDTVDTMVDTVDVTLARDPLMLNPRLKPLPLLHPKLKLRLNLTMDTTDTDITPDTTADTDTVTSAKDPPMLNPKLKLNLPTDTTDTVILAKGPLKPNLSLSTDPVDTMVVDTMAMVDTVDTTMVEMHTSG